MARVRERRKRRRHRRASWLGLVLALAAAGAVLPAQSARAAMAPPGPVPEPSAEALTGDASPLAIRKLKRNRRRGTVVLLVSVPLPAAGTIALSGNDIKPVSRPVPDSGSVRLPVIGDRQVRRTLRLHGRRAVTASVTYAPAGAAAISRTMRLVLVKRRSAKPPCVRFCGTGTSTDR